MARGDQIKKKYPSVGTFRKSAKRKRAKKINTNKIANENEEKEINKIDADRKVPSGFPQNVEDILSENDVCMDEDDLNSEQQMTGNDDSEQERETGDVAGGSGSEQASEKASQGQGQQEETHQPPSPNALKVAAAECLNSWVNYLQMLNTMCSAGLRLSHSLSILSQAQNIPLANQCQNSWDELTRATIFASNSVKTHIAAAMQDMSIGDTFTEEDAQRQQDHNQQIIRENLSTFINLQYQFSIAGCEIFGFMATCPSCQATPGGIHESDCSMAALQQCFARLSTVPEPRSQTSSPNYQSDSPKEVQKGEARQHSPMEPRGASPYQDVPHRGPSPIQGFPETIRGPGMIETIRGPFPNPGQLHTMKAPFPGRGSRSPLHFPLFPLSGQRRWSEAAAGEVVEDSGDGTMRRWSMPWDSGRVEAGPWHQRYLPSKLVVPTSGASQERSRSTTPEATPSTQPGTISSGDGLAEAIQLLSCRPTRCSIPQTSLPGHALPGSSFIPPWAETHEERMHRRMYPGPASQRGNWQSIDAPHPGMSVTEHYDIFPPGMPLVSRKSSSSTDSSSCLSIHSRSTASSERGSDSASGGDAIRITGNLYSMWSGSEHLPFIRLPESHEPQDDSDTDDPPTEKNGGSPFPKPT